MRLIDETLDCKVWYPKHLFLNTCVMLSDWQHFSKKKEKPHKPKTHNYLQFSSMKAAIILLKSTKYSSVKKDDISNDLKINHYHFNMYKSDLCMRDPNVVLSLLSSVYLVCYFSIF